MKSTLSDLQKTNAKSNCYIAKLSTVAFSSEILSALRCEITHSLRYVKSTLGDLAINRRKIKKKGKILVFFWNYDPYLREIIHSGPYVKRDGPAYQSDSLPETKRHFHVKLETIFCEKNTFQVFFSSAGWLKLFNTHLIKIHTSRISKTDRSESSPVF